MQGSCFVSWGFSLLVFPRVQVLPDSFFPFLPRHPVLCAHPASPAVSPLEEVELCDLTQEGSVRPEEGRRPALGDQC